MIHLIIATYSLQFHYTFEPQLFYTSTYSHLSIPTQTYLHLLYSTNPNTTRISQTQPTSLFIILLTYNLPSLLFLHYQSQNQPSHNYIKLPLSQNRINPKNFLTI
ncbi:hypothetical protein HanIR_Chr05g0251061 [Helianthus annuus]|nr:hypothetical protein HanIR_Chr05g0251061 [Helianthus annuus]